MTTTAGSARKLRRVTVHRARHLHPADVERIDDLPVTTLERTLLDLAETEPFHFLETVFEEVDRRDDLDLRAIGACIARNPGRRGIRPLTRLLDGYLAVGSANEGLERLFQCFLGEEGFPQPQTKRPRRWAARRLSLARAQLRGRTRQPRLPFPLGAAGARPGP